MLRTSAAIAAGKLTRAVAKRRGGGSALPGLVAEKVDPKILGHALGGLPGGIVVVSGTNGKTTTTRMLVALLRAHGLSVFTNPTGSNFTRGVISALLGEVGLRGRPVADVAVLELDEAHALKFADAVTPTHALLLNVARDQLDRFAEIDHTAKLLAQLAARTSKGVVMNRDDSFVARSAEGVKTGVTIDYFGVDDSIAHRLPELMEQDTRVDDEYVVPPAGADDILLRPVDERSLEILVGPHGAGGIVGPVELKQRGLAAMINATAATAMARRLLGSRFDAATAANALATVTAPFGRGEVIDADGAPLELVLVKNPAGFTVALSTYGSTPVRTMIAINDNYADGRDVSWLYDVSFESLREVGVSLTSGVRAYDMALRLQYDEVPVADVEPDLESALDRFLRERDGQPARIFCTYTAMMTLRRRLAERYNLPAFGEEGS
ncbi:MAG: MurT ligase domain-containing protein [Actinobacteria bacterium]|uniref:Lipid II isoglutaminyl synthase (glutamine-hydrolyzing) subunit MurT n=1 Tax=Nostocoides veronense TaxID=330836 RepID=A0ABN2LHB0_9MICO|nr:MurT ligase domain-containing protein [Actinomycetota bacterium]